MTGNIQLLAEKLDSSRIKWLKVSALGFLLWYGLRIVDKYFLEESLTLLIVLQLTGLVIWLVSLYYIRKILIEIRKDDQIGAILNDEWTEVNRMKSWRAGFIIMIFTQGIILGTSFFVGLPAAFSAEVSILSGVIGAIGAFILFHR